MEVAEQPVLVTHLIASAFIKQLITSMQSYNKITSLLRGMLTAMTCRI